jgi:hypothetical protein
MDKIASLMEMLAPLDGSNATHLPGTAIYKEIQHRGRQPFLYNQGVVLIGQGSKRVYLGNTTCTYDPETYLVVSVPIPAECEIDASAEAPLLALIVDIDIGMLNRIISHAVQNYVRRKCRGPACPGHEKYKSGKGRKGAQADTRELQRCHEWVFACRPCYHEPLGISQGLQ